MTKPYKGRPYIKQLAHLKPGYKEKNDAGGRKCIMAQSAEYKRVHIFQASRFWNFRPAGRFKLEAR